LKTVNA